MKILAVGLDGLVGSRVQDLLKDKYQFDNISRSTGVDIANASQVDSPIANTEAEIVLLLAAKTNVDACEEDKALGKDGEAWVSNVIGAQNVANAAQKYNKKLIYVSTDFVFKGDKDMYSEDDEPTEAVNWYGQTKLEAEKIVRQLPTPWTIVRPAFPYRANYERLDFVRAIKGRLEQNLPIKGIADNMITPTFIDDFANALDILISKNATGIYHVVGSSSLSSYDAAQQIAEVFDLDRSLISKTSSSEYFAGKAPRPFKLALKNDKIKTLGVEMKTFTEGLQTIKSQL